MGKLITLTIQKRIQIIAWHKIHGIDDAMAAAEAYFPKGITIFLRSGAVLYDASRTVLAGITIGLKMAGRGNDKELWETMFSPIEDIAKLLPADEKSYFSPGNERDADTICKLITMYALTCRCAANLIPATSC